MWPGFNAKCSPIASNNNRTQNCLHLQLTPIRQPPVGRYFNTGQQQIGRKLLDPVLELNGHARYCPCTGKWQKYKRVSALHMKPLRLTEFVDECWVRPRPRAEPQIQTQLNDDDDDEEQSTKPNYTIQAGCCPRWVPPELVTR